MIEIKKGVIREELFARPGIKGFKVLVGDKEAKCIAYPDLVGEVRIGDEVLLNTTAVTLNLGTGGYHYIMANLSRPEKSLSPGGHIMKLRYTPMQLKVLSVEEEASPYHEKLKYGDSLDNTPVLVATLHSMLAPLCLQLAREGFKIAYVMTDGAALPIYFSHTVSYLKEKRLLSGTVTVGHAFGGDLEAVNIYSGLLAAKEVFRPDVIVVSMGPGIVGTGTRWGFTGIEQGDILNAVEVLQGLPVCVPRISFTDPRSRHKGISHHTLTVISRVCRARALLPLPVMDEDKMSYVFEQLRYAGSWERYQVCLEDGHDILEILEQAEINITTMGRGVKEEKEFFLALGASAAAVIKILKGQPLNRVQLV
ncbi:Protein of unknown function [Thermosyntropha lipolytica DSM 11003]|uniref:DUF3866 domain-containing protein n=1 Tax=Thermosyntropha lipolytica DSM 11003 TaxID=1123382 RepID=A0A1M5J7X8_9FIRM|nr:DUF3866 family protein [Thermosyntropha lipolytica]SHG36652.1 Protein of unknown function [Thermosyntropha lipolytica DSM 11003]